MDLQNLSFLSFLIICFNIPDITANDSSKLTPSSIFEYWKIVENRFILNNRKDIVLLMGITGSGKSTLGVLLTEPEMLEVFEDEMTGDVKLLDKKHRISENATITSKTLVPELMTEESSGTAYYDCPGFSDTRGLYFDLTSAYFLRRLLEFADAIKFVFVASHESVKITGSRNNFINLAKHVTTLVKDITKYRNGTALAVTKVTQNRKSRKLGPQILVNGIVDFLRETKKELATMKINNDTSSMDSETNEKITNFVDILLECDDKNEFKRISILRQPEEQGSVAKIKTMQEDREAFKNVIINNLQYVTKGDNDFAYTIATDTKIQIFDFLQNLSSTWTENLLKLLHEIKTFYLNQEKHVIKLQETHNLLTVGFQNFIDVEFIAPKSFYSNLIDGAHQMNIPIDNWKEYLNDIVSDDFYGILKIVSDDKHSILFEYPVKSLNELKKYITESKQWYDFIFNLHSILLHFNDFVDVEKLVAQCSNDDGEINISKMTELKTLLAQINNKTLDAVYAKFSSAATVDFLKKTALKTVLSQTIYNQSFPICPENDNLSVTGYTVRISDVIKNAKCWKEAKLIQIFALDKVIIDADIDKIGKNATVAIIAPSWRISGKREINLAGIAGSAREPTNASEGKNRKENGRNGEPGLAGGSGGHFFGFGNQFTNAELLEIIANGGRGGVGQDGGNGS